MTSRGLLTTLIWNVLIMGCFAQDRVENTIGMSFRFIPAGEGVLGSLKNNQLAFADESPQRRNVVTRGFYMGITEVTQHQWIQIMPTRPWNRLGLGFAKNAPDLPATFISWDDATRFCKMLSKKEGRKYRLPSESEWEYACRANTQTPFFFGSDPKMLSSYAWHDDGRTKGPQPVGLKRPNPWGLKDTYGNVWEWCRDPYYKNKKEAIAQFRVLRGGAWALFPECCRSAARRADTHDAKAKVYGFRVLLEK